MSAEASDEHLIARTREGDVDAYGALVRRHQEVAFRTALAMCSNRADAEDAVQEAAIKAFYALPRFRAGAPWRPWLLRIVANEARNRRRSAGRRERLALRAGAERQATPARPEEILLAGVERRALAEALLRLDAAQREVVVLRHLVGLSELECAAVLDCPTGTVKSRLSRGLDRLRATLEAGDA